MFNFKIYFCLLFFISILCISGESPLYSEEKSFFYSTGGFADINYSKQKSYSNYGVFLGTDYYSDAWSVGAAAKQFLRYRLNVDEKNYDIYASNLLFSYEYAITEKTLMHSNAGASLGQNSYVSGSGSAGLSYLMGKNNFDGTLTYVNERIKDGNTKVTDTAGGSLSWKLEREGISPEMKYEASYTRDNTNVFDNSLRIGLSYTVFGKTDLMYGIKGGVDSDKYFLSSMDAGFFSEITEHMLLYFSYVPSEYFKNYSSFTFDGINHEFIGQLTFLF